MVLLLYTRIKFHVNTGNSKVIFMILYMLLIEPRELQSMVYSGEGLVVTLKIKMVCYCNYSLDHFEFQAP